MSLLEEQFFRDYCDYDSESWTPKERLAEKDKLVQKLRKLPQEVISQQITRSGGTILHLAFDNVYGFCMGGEAESPMCCDVILRAFDTKSIGKPDKVNNL
eukprot:TRINITY_DN3912_c0_g1_i3.p1 TRINITY_DN3912_c0_g1~~TRINITY_DN3912_c0_g1_i3.p1  ORF type:complete len:107 (-),score=18.03 TRINITY_DN3912_c0_g1_i3:584-883(-)